MHINPCNILLVRAGRNIFLALFFNFGGSVAFAQPGGTSAACDFTVQEELVNPRCFDSHDGRIRLEVADLPTTNVQFSWLNLSSANDTNEATNLAAGSYAVIVSNEECADTLTYSLVAPPPIDAPFFDTTLCGGAPVNLLQGVSGGTGNYFFSASTFIGTPTNCNTCPSPVFLINQTTLASVQITDENGCTVDRLVFVEVLPPLEAEVSTTDETCNGNGAIEVNASGGSGNYFFSLDGGPYQNAGVFSGLAGDADYEIEVLDLEGCIAVANATIEYSPEFTVPTAIDVTPVSCFGADDGVISLVIQVDNADILFALDDPANVINPTTAPVFQDVKPGQHFVYIIEDGGDCINQYPAFMPEPLPLSLDSIALDSTTCPGGADGEAEFFLSGGNGGYEYSVDDSAFSTGNFFTGLSPGDHILVFQDSVGCTGMHTFSIEEPEAPDLGVMVTPSCPGDSTGSIVVVETGKLLIGEYLFSLDSIHWQSQNLFEGLPAGLYTIFIQYPDGCVYTVFANVPQPAPLLANLTAIGETCSDGNGVIASAPTGGTPPYSLLWSTGDTLSVIAGLEAGVYFITVTDADECFVEDSAAVEALPGPILLAETTHAPCHGMTGGAIDLTVLAGTPPFHYTWSNGAYTQDISGLPAGSYVVTVYDANLCRSTRSYTIHQPPPIELSYQAGPFAGFWFINLIVDGGAPPYSYEWSNGETTQDVFNLEPGIYSVTVTDQQSCTRRLDIEVGITDVEESPASQKITVFPVPARDRLWIRLDDPALLSARLTLIDAAGRAVHQPALIENTLEEIDVRGLPAGLYFLRLEWERMVFRQKILKE